MRDTISIIGGGISGITTAVTLQLLGYQTLCFAEHLVDEDAPHDPRFASLYPAASVIPHSVHNEHLNSLFPNSLSVFGMLYKKAFPGIAKHRHFEVFEFPVEAPDYTSFLENYLPLQQIQSSRIPHRPEAPVLYGWRFDCFVGEWPVYIQQLYKLYKQLGGKIHKKKVLKNEIGKLPSEVIINCSGIWSRELFEDTAETKITRGHTVHIFDKPKVKDSEGRICSYNYTPLPSIYATPEGEPCDVYFYPIGNKWILGGSRESGSLNKTGQWSGKVSAENVRVKGKTIPSSIIDLNGEILRNIYQQKLQPEEKMKSSAGYRFERGDVKNGLRLEKTREHGKKVIHNYGHGGAGVTLSWGCGLKVAELLEGKGAEGGRLLGKLLQKLS